jgi:hypothetical protein
LRANHQDQLLHEIGVIGRESRGDEAAERDADHGCGADLLSKDLRDIPHDRPDGIIGGRRRIVAQHIDRSACGQQARDALGVPLGTGRRRTSDEGLAAVQDDDGGGTRTRFHKGDSVEEQTRFECCHGRIAGRQLAAASVAAPNVLRRVLEKSA